MVSSSPCGDKRFGSFVGFQIERLATRSERELPVVWLGGVFLNLSAAAGASHSVSLIFLAPLPESYQRLEFE